MDIIKNRIDFEKIRYKGKAKKKQPLCQAYNLDDSNCKRLASSDIKIDIGKLIKDYTGYELPFACCFLCKQHLNIIVRELSVYIFSKTLSSIIRNPLVTGIDRFTFSAADYEKQDEILAEFRKLDFTESYFFKNYIAKNYIS